MSFKKLWIITVVVVAGALYSVAMARGGHGGGHNGNHQGQSASHNGSQNDQSEGQYNAPVLPKKQTPSLYQANRNNTQKNN